MYITYSSFAVINEVDYQELISEKYKMSRPAWKAVLSEAVVTEDFVLGM